MISIKKELMDSVFRHCLKEIPNEACGILAGQPASAAGQLRQSNRERRVTKVYPLENIDKSPVSYSIDTKVVLKLQKTEWRNSGLEMLGIYHSHVGSTAFPSERDVNMAFYPDASYVIVSLKDKDRPLARSFRIIDGKIEEEEIKLI